jgi:hypothetical protein
MNYVLGLLTMKEDNPKYATKAMPRDEKGGVGPRVPPEELRDWIGMLPGAKQ